jgi:hypothetical protein
MLGAAGCLGVEALGQGNWYDAPMWVSTVVCWGWVGVLGRVCWCWASARMQGMTVLKDLQAMQAPGAARPALQANGRAVD